MALAAVSDGEIAQTSAGNIGKGVVALLALCVFINYVDRGNLATASPLMQDELRLSNTQIGILLSAFFWTYVPGQILSGWLAEKINAYRTLALGLAIWSTATAATGLVSGFSALIALRLLLGLGESAAFPCSSKLLAQHLPRNRLGAANGLIATGLALGPAFGTYGGGTLMAHVGWRPVFLVFGLASMLWLIPWLFATRDASSNASTEANTDVPSFWAILKQRSAWGTYIGHFGANYMFYFVISWLPLYLVKARGFSVGEMAEIGGGVYIIQAISAQVSGLVSDRWMHAGASDTLVRKTFLIASMLGTAASLLICIGTNPTASVIGLLLAALFFGMGTASIYAMGQTLGGPRAGGKWVALQNCAGNLAGILAPLVTGFVVDRTGVFSLAFLLAAFAGVAGAIGWGFVIRRVEPVQWNAN